MLTTGGDPLQVTHDEEDKDVYRFSPDGTEVYYARSVGAPEVWAVPVLGGTPHRLFTGDPGIPSLDGQFIYRVDEKGHAILRSDRTGMRDDVIYRDEKVDVGLGLVYPDGKSLLMGKWWSPFSVGHFFKLDLTTKTALALGTVSERQGHLLY